MLCVASADASLRARAVEVLCALGHGPVEAPSLAALCDVAPDVRTVLVDLRMPDLGAAPMSTLRATPCMHGRRIVPLRDAEVEAFTRGAADPALIALLLHIELQLAADRQIELLGDLSRRLTAAPEMVPTMDALLDAVSAHLPSDTSTLFLLNSAGRLKARAARGYELGDAVFRAVEVGAGVVGWVAANRIATIVGDSDIDARFASAGSRGSRSMLAAPVMVGDRVLGALTLVRRAPAEQFTDSDLTLLATIGASAGIALEKARLFERERAVTERLLEVQHTLGLEQEMLRKLETYDRLYTQVVATVSHELKTPLMSIRGFAKLLADGDADADEARDFGGEIHANAVRLSRYVDEILDEDAVHSGRMAISIGPVDLAALAAEVLASLRNAAGASHELVASVPAPLPSVAGDDERLRQVLVNLVTNAIKYSPRGGPVEVGAAVNGEHVVLTVTDSGIGIPEPERQRVFDRFYRVTSEETRSIGGTGLGLSIVRGIVDLHGGRIWIEDGPDGRGTRFCVSLPVLHTRLAETRVPRHPAVRPTARRRLAGIALNTASEVTA